MINPAKPGLLSIAAVAFLALATGARANQISAASTTAAPTSDPPTTESTEAGGGGGPEAATQPAPVASAPGTAPAISNSVQESRLQAMTRRDQSGDGAHNSGVAESTATAQGIWQVQISSCKAHCRGLSQTQTANQRNRTVQTLGASRHLTLRRRQLLKDNRAKTNSGPIPTTHTGAGVDPPSNTQTGLAPVATGGPTESGSRGLTQIQFGCISHCFGTATSTSQAPLRAHPPTLEQLLEEIARAMPILNDVPAAEQSTVAQMSHQWQYGSGAGPGQTQTASQDNTTIQSHDASPTAAAGPGLGDSVPELVNQTEQGIWQLQIGCLAFCSETRQVQRAEQSNTTTRSGGSGRDPSSQPPTSSVNVTTQTVWQIQVGCLMWCFDTEQQQTASSENSEAELPGQETSEGTLPPAGASPAAPAPQPAGVPPTAGTRPTADSPSPASSVPRNPCNQSPTPRECNPTARVGGAGPQVTGAPAMSSSRPANRAWRGGSIVTGRSRWSTEATAGHTVTARAVGADAGTNAAIYQFGVLRTRLTPPRKVTGPRPSSGGHRQGPPVSRSLAAGMSSTTGSGSDPPIIALVAAIALCTLAIARAFRSKPFPRRRATEK